MKNEWYDWEKNSLVDSEDKVVARFKTEKEAWQCIENNHNLDDVWVCDMPNGDYLLVEMGEELARDWRTMVERVNEELKKLKGE